MTVAYLVSMKKEDIRLPKLLIITTRGKYDMIVCCGGRMFVGNDGVAATTVGNYYIDTFIVGLLSHKFF